MLKSLKSFAKSFVIFSVVLCTSIHFFEYTFETGWFAGIAACAIDTMINRGDNNGN